MAKIGGKRPVRFGAALLRCGRSFYGAVWPILDRQLSSKTMRKADISRRLPGEAPSADLDCPEIVGPEIAQVDTAGLHARGGSHQAATIGI